MAMLLVFMRTTRVSYRMAMLQVFMWTTRVVL